MNHMNESRKQMAKMEQEVKGYGIETCFGAGGCPNRACHTDDLPEMMEKVLDGKDLKGFLLRKVKGPLKRHHEFRVSVSDCPNGCSRPQIADFGLLGAERPKVSKEPCNACGACEAICKEEAVLLQGRRSGLMNPDAWFVGNVSGYALPEPSSRRRRDIESCWAASWEGIPGWRRRCRPFTRLIRFWKRWISVWSTTCPFPLAGNGLERFWNGNPMATNYKSDEPRT